jgi:gliotoxin/aspirochlorine biosynthesis thioredoxin reductase
MATNPLFDVVIIGGGPAGLAVATGVARQRFTAVVLDAGKARIDAASHMHNVVTWDHEPPAAFRAKARRDLSSRYETVSFVDGVEVARVERVEPGEGGGVVEFLAFASGDGPGSEERKWRGRKLVLATGSRDLLPPEVDGLQHLYGRLIFPCLSCHGYELRGGSAAGVLAVGNTATVAYASHFARMIMPLVEDAGKVTVYTSDPGGDFTSTIRNVLDGSSIVAVEPRKVKGLEERDGKVVVRLEGDGGEVEEREEAFLVSAGPAV